MKLLFDILQILYIFILLGILVVLPSFSFDYGLQILLIFILLGIAKFANKEHIGVFSPINEEIFQGWLGFVIKFTVYSGLGLIVFYVLLPTLSINIEWGLWGLTLLEIYTRSLYLVLLLITSPIIGKFIFRFLDQISSISYRSLKLIIGLFKQNKEEQT